MKYLICMVGKRLNRLNSRNYLKMSPIPDRWIEYKACGRVIEGTRLICFKVPLSKKVQTGNRYIREIWDIPALLTKIPNLCAVIDLTNTARYYEPAEVVASGVLHKKILMPGRVIPPEGSVTEFMNAVDEFFGKNGDSLVGVHCTHGLNRTGYMVCRYMRDRLGIPAKEAIKKFEKARGYQIERANYIADLLGMSPPAPDIGKQTNIKPVYNTLDYGTRHVQEQNYEEQERDRYNKHRSYKRDRRSSSRRSRKYERNRRSRSITRSRSRRRSRSRSSRSRSSSYDFRYDY